MDHIIVMLNAESSQPRRFWVLSGRVVNSLIVMTIGVTST
jgi:hypothetical protein